MMVAALVAALLINGVAPEAAAQAPTVVSTYPANGATNVSRSINVISVTFSKAMNTGGVSIGSSGWGSSAWGYGNQDKTFYYTRINDLAKLAAGAAITFTLNGQGTTGFQDTSGNPLQTYTFSFTIGNDSELQRIDANPGKGFYWPYFLSIPTSVGPSSVLLVEPNNSGTWSDDPAFHETAARNLILSRSDFATDLGVPLLVPTFPRPINPQAPEPGGIYTQALDRYSLYLPSLPVNLQRIDLQLIAMIKDAKERLAAMGHRMDRKVFFMGFSASGAFVSRFSALHPEIVKAAAPGSPGGWPIAPVGQWSATTLPYPVGVFDVEQLVGKPFDLETFKKVPKYIYVGDVDTNDALDVRDMPQYKNQICALLDCSTRPFISSRWPIAEQMYNSVGASGQFVVYPGVVHTITTRMFDNLHTFFEQNKSPWISNSANALIDFDADGKSDTAVYRVKNGNWLIIPSGGSSYTSVFGGDPSDKPVARDYDGDGKTDIAVYRASSGAWYIKPSSGAAPYGLGWGGDPSDKPVPGDYDGDGKADIAVYRASTGAWYIQPSSGAASYGVGWGGDPSDKPVPGDYDGDGKTDTAVYRASSGAWYIKPSSGAAPYGVGCGGNPSDKPVPGDYDGDGKTDIAVYRTSTGSWYIYPSGGGSPYTVGWGGDSSDIPLTANPD